MFPSAQRKSRDYIHVTDLVRAHSAALAPRRPGDPATIVARSDRIRSVFGWKPQFDDLATIAWDALAWELQLASRPERKAGPAIAAA